MVAIAMRLVAGVAWAFVAVAALLMSACASSPPGATFEPEVVDPNKAVMYVFRPTGGGLGARTFQVFINQELVGTLRPGQYLSHVAAPGEYFVRVESESSMVQRVKLVPGDVAYLRVGTAPFAQGKPTVDFPESDVARHLISRTTRSGAP
jgi:hypothetical protein